MKQQRKTKTSKRTRIRFTLIFTFLLGAAIIIVAPLFHLVLPKTNPEVDRFEITLDKKIEDIEAQIAKAKDDYKIGLISAETAYLKIYDELLPKRTEQLAINKNLLKEKIDSERVFGWKTWRAFANGWGQRLPYLVLVVGFTFLFFLLDFKNKIVYWALLFFQLAAYTMTVYQQVYSFWPGQDLPLKTYRWLILSVGFMLAASIMLLMQYVVTRTKIYQEIIKILQGVIVSDVRLYVKDEEKYDDELMWPTLKKVADEF